MKNKMLLGFLAVVLVFLGGSIAALYSLVKAEQRMDRLILLHQIETLREELIIRVQQVQSHLSHSRLQNGGNVDVLIAQVQEMDRVMDSCLGCHHSPELSQGLLGIRDTANDYKTAISRLVTTSGDRDRFSALERRAQEIGQELASMTQGMAFTANAGLQEKTKDAMGTIREVRYVLYGTFALGLFLSGVTAHRLGKILDKRLRRLKEAAQGIAHGELPQRIDIAVGGDGEFRDLEEALNAVIRKLRHSQRQLVQSAKLTAVSETATTIAYELNNPLTGIHGSVDLLLRAEDISPVNKEHLRAIERDTLRARGTLKGILDFARRRPPQLMKTAVSAVIRDAVSRVEAQAGQAKVEIKADCPGALPLVDMDVEEMKQAFVHLFSNGIYAMPTGGVLTIRCSHVRDTPGKEAVAVEISDTGRGIPEEQLDKIFDPFFSLQQDGDGAGLGLAVSYMIVHHHGGRIEVESKVGRGSVFTVILPA